MDRHVWGNPQWIYQYNTIEAALCQQLIVRFDRNCTIRGNRIVNNWLYEGPGGLVLINTGYDTVYRRLRRKLDVHGISLTDIRYIFP